MLAGWGKDGYARPVSERTIQDSDNASGGGSSGAKLDRGVDAVGGWAGQQEDEWGGLERVGGRVTLGTRTAVGGEA